MTKNLLFVAVLFLLTGCYSQRKMDEVQQKLDAVTAANKDCEESLEKANTDISELEKEAKEQAQLLKDIKKLNDALEEDTLIMGRNYRRLKLANSDLTAALEKQVRVNRQMNADSEQQNRKLYNELLALQKELEEKEAKLNERDNNLTRLNSEVKKREEKVEELTRLINEKDSLMKSLQETVASALLNFKDKGISVDIKGDKVYVSLEEEILFASGKYNIGKSAKTALLELSKVLNQNPDISILVEGHTDDDPIKTTCIKDNYDLSVLRATEITRILVDQGNVDPKMVTAAGRGEYLPVASNSTTDGKKKNRRIEIILTPNLDKLYNIINE